MLYPHTVAAPPCPGREGQWRTAHVRDDRRLGGARERHCCPVSHASMLYSIIRTAYDALPAHGHSACFIVCQSSAQMPSEVASMTSAARPESPSSPFVSTLPGRYYYDPAVYALEV